MGYQRRTIGDFVDRMNSSIFLPGIQRGFEWKKEKIPYLFDSILRGYPIGQFLIWKPTKIPNNQIMYKFIENYGDAREPPKDSNYRNLELEETEKEEINSDSLEFVLDGQQRLTSLLIGLKGSFREKNGPDWSKKQKLYIDLLSGEEEEGISEREHKYNIEFKSSRPETKDNELWFRMGRILNYPDDLDTLKKELQKEYRNEIEETDISTNKSFKRRDRIVDNLSNIHDKIHNEQLSYFSKETDNHTKVLDIFLRTNEEGIKLPKSDIILSILTDKWSQIEGDMNAREEIKRFSDELHTEFDKTNFGLNVVDIVNTIAVFVGLNKEYKLRDFNKNELEKARMLWDQEKIQESIRKAIKLLIDFKFTGKTAPPAVVIPLAYYFYRNPKANIQLNDEGKENRKKIHQWVCGSLLDQNFTRRGPITDEIINKIDNNTTGKDGSFPLEEIKEISVSGYSLEISRRNIKDELERSRATSSSGAFALLSMIYYPEPAIEREIHIDHIFPKSKIKEEHLKSEIGLSEEKAKRFVDKKNTVCNYQMLTQNENLSKQNQDFKTWIEDRDAKFKEKHCIPKDTQLYEYSNFDRFIDERRDLITEKLMDEFH